MLENIAFFDKSHVFILVVRVIGGGNFVKNKIRYSASSKKGSRRNPFLRNGDIIFVNKGAIGNLTEVTSEIFSPFIGIFSFLEIIDGD